MKKRTKKIIGLITICIAAIGLLTYGINASQKSADYRRKIDNLYNRNYFELVGYVQNIESFILKSRITVSPEKTANLLEEAWRSASLAEACLSQLPVDQALLSSVSKFLVQVGDVANALGTQNINGKPMTEEQNKMTEDLQGYAKDLSNGLDSMTKNVTSGNWKWENIEKNSGKMFGEEGKIEGLQDITTINKSFEKYPTLIYDGPFSDHINDIKAKGITGDQITEQQGVDKVISLFPKNEISEVQFISKNDNTNIKTYSYNIKFKDKERGEGSIDITQQGGHTYWLLVNREAGEKKLDADQAKEEGLKYLESIGIKDMKPSYYLIEGGDVTINYSSFINDVMIYPDMVKVKISLDKGYVIGYEGKAYLTNHTERIFEKPKITIDEARKKINTKLQITSSRQAIIPTKFGTEKYVYEFRGTSFDSEFLIYINADTGLEEDVLIIIQDENGTLTV